MPKLYLPEWMIQKYANTMKHILGISASLWIIKPSRESGLKVIHKNPLTRNQIVLPKFHFLRLILHNGLNFGRSATGFPNWQDVNLTLSKLATDLGLFTCNQPVSARKLTWLNPIQTIQKCHCSISLRSVFRFLLCFPVAKMVASRADAVHCWARGSWAKRIGRFFRNLNCIVVVWRSGYLWYPFTFDLTTK